MTLTGKVIMLKDIHNVSNKSDKGSDTDVIAELLPKMNNYQVNILLKLY